MRRIERGLCLGSRKEGRNGECRVKGVIVVEVGRVLRRSLAVGIVEKEERDIADWFAEKERRKGGNALF